MEKMQDRLLKEIKETLQEFQKKGLVEKVYLFGSYASGNNTAESDIDICVLTTATQLRPLDLQRQIRMQLFQQIKLPVDLIVFNRANFYDRIQAGASFERNIIESGVEL